MSKEQTNKASNRRHQRTAKSKWDVTLICLQEMCLANFGWGKEQSMVHVGLDVFSP